MCRCARIPQEDNAALREQVHTATAQFHYEASCWEAERRGLHAQSEAASQRCEWLQTQLHEREGELAAATERIRELEGQLTLVTKPSSGEQQRQPVQPPASAAPHGELPAPEGAAAKQVLEARIAALQAVAEMQERELFKLGAWAAVGER